MNSNFDNEKEINKYLNTFCINEMSKRKWITLKDSSSYTQNAMDLLDYLGISNFDNINKYYIKRKMMLILIRYIYGLKDVIE